MQIGLNFDSNFWDAFPIELKDGEWKKIWFHETSRSRIRSWPPVKCVYAVILSLKGFSEKNPFSELTYVLYVGKSKNLNNRFRVHTRGGDQKNLRYKLSSHVGTSNLNFWYIELPTATEADLRKYEQKLIDLFGKVLNDRNEIRQQKIYEEESIEATLYEEE